MISDNKFRNVVFDYDKVCGATCTFATKCICCDYKLFYSLKDVEKQYSY